MIDDNKPAPWADALLTVWVIVVGIVYFGGLFVPAIGVLTGSFGAFYAIMVLAGALTLARKFLHPVPKDVPAPAPRPKKRK